MASNEEFEDLTQKEFIEQNTMFEEDININKLKQYKEKKTRVKKQKLTDEEKEILRLQKEVEQIEKDRVKEEKRLAKEQSDDKYVPTKGTKRSHYLKYLKQTQKEVWDKYFKFGNKIFPYKFYY